MYGSCNIRKFVESRLRFVVGDGSGRGTRARGPVCRRSGGRLAGTHSGTRARGPVWVVALAVAMVASLLAGASPGSAQDVTTTPQSTDYSVHTNFEDCYNVGGWKRSKTSADGRIFPIDPAADFDYLGGRMLYEDCVQPPPRCSSLHSSSHHFHHHFNYYYYYYYYHDDDYHHHDYYYYYYYHDDDYHHHDYYYYYYYYYYNNNVAAQGLFCSCYLCGLLQRWWLEA